MGISRKIALLQIIFSVSFICVILIMNQLVWEKSYLKLEQDQVEENEIRACVVWNAKFEMLGALVSDWAPWDELVDFVHNPATSKFAEDNLADSQMANLRLNLALVTDPGGRIVFAKGVDFATKAETAVPPETLAEISGLIRNKVLVPEDDQYAKGFIVVDGQPLLLVMQNILTSEKQGPSPGVLIFGKYADETLFEDISKKTQVELFFQSELALPQFLAGIAPSHQVTTEENILHYNTLLDAYGNPRYLVSATPRSIYRQGKAQMNSLLLFTVIFGVLFILITLFLLNRMILSRVRRMDSFMNSIVYGSDYSVRLELPGGDELSKAAATMNNMLRQIEASHKKIEGLYDAVRSELEERWKAEENLKYLSMHDKLTGLYNRTFFEQEVDAVAARQVQSVGVVCCDLDGLKIVNDTMGHHVGDLLLAETAGILTRAFGDEALVARSGGDEFVVLLFDSGEGQIRQVCEQLATVEVKDPEGRGIWLHLSLGWAYRGGGGLTTPILKNLIKQADDLMYRQKLSSSHSRRSNLVQGMLEMLKARDFITEGHSQRLQHYVKILAQAINLREERLADLTLLAQFHDVGKVGIADRILLKPGPLTPEERKEMERHSEIGHRIARAIPELMPISDYILKHHEWWNGEGYPLGLKGEEIPLEDRILAIADAYDAMTGVRPYRKALSVDMAVAELRLFAGTQFDPELVEKFVALVLAASRPPAGTS